MSSLLDFLEQNFTNRKSLEELKQNEIDSFRKKLTIFSVAFLSIIAGIDFFLGFFGVLLLLSFIVLILINWIYYRKLKELEFKKYYRGKQRVVEL